MKQLLLILLILLLNSFAYPQGISELKLLDGYSAPLSNDDNGITFEYITKSRGTLNAYLRTSLEDFRLFSNMIEFKGLGEIHIPPEKY